MLLLCCRKFFFIFLLIPIFVATAEEEKSKKPMKILMVVSSFPKIHDICIINHIIKLIDRGHDVRIYSVHKGDTVNVQEDVVKYHLMSRTMYKLPSSLNKYDIVMFQLGHKLFDIRNVYRKIIKKRGNGFKGKIAVRLLGYDITAFLHENPHAYDYYFDSCDLFLPVCNAFVPYLIKAGCPAQKIVVSHSSIDCSRFTFKPKDLPLAEETLTILTAGRFVEKKGYIYSIRAIAKLIKKYPNIRYRIVGNGPQKALYQDLINQLGMSNRITLEDWHPHDEYIPLLHNSHIFVLTSVTAKNNDQEGIPNVLIEAMATGLITVATDHSGNSELITHGKTGFLVPERDSEAIYNTLTSILEHKESFLPMQLAAMQKVHEEFENEKENDKLEAILYGLLKK